RQRAQDELPRTEDVNEEQGDRHVSRRADQEVSERLHHELAGPARFVQVERHLVPQDATTTEPETHEDEEPGRDAHEPGVPVWRGVPQREPCQPKSAPNALQTPCHVRHFAMGSRDEEPFRRAGREESSAQETGGRGPASRIRLPKRRVRRAVPQQERSPRPQSARRWADRKSTRLNSSHVKISYAVLYLKKKK